jgi:DNA-binding CsgD family transcriptional regulator
MRPFWGRLGILLPIYRLVGQGLTDREITSRLNLADDKVQDCISWMVHFLELSDRSELVQHAAAQQTSGAYHLEIANHGSKSGLRSEPTEFAPHTCVTSTSPVHSAARKY